jgi:polysaccharide biosynthesis transport protein
MIHENNEADVFINLLEIVAARKAVIITAFIIVFSITCLGAYFMRPLYTASTSLSVNMPAVPRADLPFLSEMKNSPFFIADQTSVIQSRMIYEKVAIELHLAEAYTKEPSFFGRIKKSIIQEGSGSLDAAIDTLYRTTEVQLMRGTNIVVITASALTAEGASDIANAIARNYLDYANGEISSKGKNAYGFVATQMSEVKNELHVAQNALLSFMKTNNISSIDTLRGERADVQNTLSAYKMKYQQHDNTSQETDFDQMEESGQGLRILSTDTPKVRELKANLINLKKELSAILRNYTENHPNVTALKEQIERVKADLAQETGARDSDKKAGGARNYMLRQIKALEAELTRLTSLEIEMSKLSRNITKNEAQYVMLEQQLAGAGFLKSDEIPQTIRIIDVAYPPSKANNKKRIILLLVGFVAALLFGLGTAFIVEYYDDSFHNREDVERYLKLRVLGTVPAVSSKTHVTK